MVGHAGNHYARGGWFTFFEVMQQLRGMEDLLMDLACGDQRVYRLRDDLLEFNMKSLDAWCAMEYDGLHFADDWGTQSSLMVSPECWRRFFKPAYQAMFDKVLAAGMDVHFHSDGYIPEIIPDLIDMGVKVINCQVALIGLEKIKRDFAGRVCFRTELDRQNILPFASPAQVRDHILEVFSHVGTADGGIIACGEIGPDVPLENIRAMYETFGSYKY